VVRKILTILLLVGGLGAIIYLRPTLFFQDTPPRIVDRLPEADFIGKADVLELARETSSMMYYHKIPFRDFTSYEFLLGQSKMYGLDLQKPVYLFGNERGDWGAMILVTDSSKVGQGLVRLKKFVEISDTIINDLRIFRYEDEKMYMHYGRNYLFFYTGDYFHSTFKSVLNAKYGEINLTWKRFLSQKHFKDEHLVIYSNWQKLKDLGIQTAMFAHDSDSLSFNLKSYLRRNTPFHIKKKKEGLSFNHLEDASRSIELHLEITDLRKNLDDPLLVWLNKMGKRFGFPLNDFLKAWDGDLCFMEGGVQHIQETYIETELDEDFNTLEVEKTRDAIVPGYSVYMSSTSHAKRFISRLLQKGIMTKTGNQFRFLFSPPLNFVQKSTSLRFFSGSSTPKIITSNRNHIIWTDAGTRYNFSIDSLNNHEIFGSLKIPVKRIFRRNKII